MWRRRRKAGKKTRERKQGHNNDSSKAEKKKKKKKEQAGTPHAHLVATHHRFWLRSLAVSPRSAFVDEEFLWKPDYRQSFPNGQTKKTTNFHCQQHKLQCRGTAILEWAKTRHSNCEMAEHTKTGHNPISPQQNTGKRPETADCAEKNKERQKKKRGLSHQRAASPHKTQRQKKR